MITPDLTLLGNEIRRRRQALGWTLERFAEEAGLTPNYIGTIETGKRDVGITSLLALARALNCGVGDLFEDPELGLSAAARDIGHQFDRATPEAQRAVEFMFQAADKDAKPANPPRRGRPAGPLS